MAHPNPTPSPTDIDWLRSLISSDRDREDVLRLATIKFGHIWGSDVAVLVDAITRGQLKDDTNALAVARAIANALEAIDESSAMHGTGTSSMTGS